MSPRKDPFRLRRPREVGLIDRRFLAASLAVIQPLVAAGVSYADIAREMATRSPHQPFRTVDPWSADLVDYVIRQSAFLRSADLEAGSSPSGTEEKT